MADPRFFSVKGPFTLAQLAEFGGAELHGDFDPDRRITDVAPLHVAGPDDLSFLQNARYTDQFRVSRAGACVIRAENADAAPDGMALLVAGNPHKSYALIARAFYPPPSAEPGISPHAFVHDSARVGEGCSIAPGAVVSARAEIGRACRIGENSVVGEGVVLGNDCWVGPCVSLAYCLIGDRVRLSAGARIGEDGFGFAVDPDTPVNVPQLGRVVIGDDVEIGSNSTIDRGAGPDTVIGDGCRIDNLVHIGHNVQLGRGCILVGQSGIAGSAKLEDYVVLAAQSGVSGHLTVGKSVRIAARGGVTRDIDPGQTVAGFPAVPFREWLRQTVVLQRLARK